MEWMITLISLATVCSNKVGTLMGKNLLPQREQILSSKSAIPDQWKKWRR